MITLGSWDSLPVNKCRPEPDYFVKPGATALLLAAALALAPLADRYQHRCHAGGRKLRRHVSK